MLQRNLYYPFGLQLDGTWKAVASPRQDYLYNGKELDEELGLNWLSYGFREYDPAIGRFPSVDPIAANFAWVSPYNYAENQPIGSIDLWGLQNVWNITWEGMQRDDPETINDPEFQEGVMDFGEEAFDVVTDEIPGVGETKAVVDGDGVGLVLALLVPGGRKMRQMYKQWKRAKKLSKIALKGYKNTGKAVIGHLEDNFEKLGKELDASIFSIDKKQWKKLKDEGVDMWGMNKEFLDKVIKNKDEVILTRSRDDVRVGSILEDEIKYLMDKGYDWKDDTKKVLVFKK